MKKIKRLLLIMLKTIIQIVMICIPVLFAVLSPYYKQGVEFNIINELGLALINGAAFIVFFLFIKRFNLWFNNKFYK